MTTKILNEPVAAPVLSQDVQNFLDADPAIAQASKVSPDVQQFLDADPATKTTPRISPDVQQFLDADPATMPGTVTTQPAPQNRIAPSTLAGDIERTAGSAFSSITLSALNAIKGVADLNAKIPLPQFVENLKERTGATALEGRMRSKVDGLIQEWGQYREQVQNEIRSEGGLSATIMQNIGDGALNTAVMLASIGATGFTGTGTTTRAAVKEAIKFGGLMAATTPGTDKERVIAGAHAAAMMLIPIPASKLPTDWMAKSANILGLNVLSAIAGDFSIQKAKDKAAANGTPDEWGKEWFAEGVPPFIINAMFGILTKSAARGNPDAKTLVENIPEEIKPLIEGIKEISQPTAAQIDLSASKPKEVVFPPEPISTPSAPTNETMPSGTGLRPTGTLEAGAGSSLPQETLPPSAQNTEPNARGEIPLDTGKPGAPTGALPSGETITPERENPSLDRSPEINRIRIEKTRATKSYADIKNVAPETQVTVYRATIPGGKIEAGDFVSPNKETAKFYARDIVGQRGVAEATVVSEEVPASQLRLHPDHQAARVENEFIYNPSGIEPSPSAGGPELIQKTQKPPGPISKWPKATKPNHEVTYMPYGPEGKGFYQQPIPKSSVKALHAAMDAVTGKVLNPDTGKPYTEGEARTSLEVAGIVDPGKAHVAEMSPEQLAESVDHLNSLAQERKPLGADAANRMGVLTTFATEPGRERLKALLQTTIESDKTLPDTKTKLGKRDPLYEQQRSKQMKEVLLAEFEKDPTLIPEAEAFMRDKAESMDTKGVIGVALFEHYRNTGNNAAQLALFDLVDPLSLGAGRFSQAWSMLNALTGKNWMVTTDRYLTRRGVTLPDAIRTEIESDFANAAKIKDPDAHAEAIHAVISKINAYVPFKVGSWLDAYRYTNMLFNPQSHERNVYGNTVQGFVTRPLVLIARGDFSGAKNYITNAWQDVMSGNALRAAKESFSSDYSKFAEYLNTPNASIFDVMQMQEGPQGAKKRLAWKALTFIPKLLNAQDKFFGSLIEAGETARLLEDGMTPAEAQKNAHILAEKLLYRERLGGEVDKSLPAFSRALDRVANLIEQARTSDQPLISWPSKLFLPFLRTPIRIAQFSVEASPLAYLGPKMNLETIAQAKYGKSFEKLSESDKLTVKELLEFRKGLASIGTIVTLMGVGSAMTGNTTWGPPQDPDAKKYFYASGRRPYYFRPPFTNKWYPMAYLGPFFLAYALPAAARDAFADNPASVDSSMISRLALAASGIPKIILSQTPVSGLSSLLDAMQGKLDKTVSASIGFQGSQFIPASGLLRWMTKIVDPTYRHPVSVLDTIKAGIPGLSDDLKAYLGANGKDAERTWTDIYLPYTIGANDLRNEKYLEIRNRQIRARLAILNMKRQ
jgi:hypothetical protein